MGQEQRYAKKENIKWQEFQIFLYLSNLQTLAVCCMYV
jgi:hypothetical protein